MSAKKTMVFEITYEVAEKLLEAHGTCYGEGQAGVPEELLAAIRQEYPELGEKYSWLYDQQRRGRVGQGE
jgi:hypothetical protein